MKHYNIPIFISHYGCKNQCVFCNQKKINGVETDLQPGDIKGIVEEYLATLPLNSIKEVAFFGGTFTAIDIKLQELFLKEVNDYINLGLIDGIRLSTSPAEIDIERLELLKKYGVKTIEIGIQSTDVKVLKESGRNYNYVAIKNSAYLIKKYGFKLGVQMMPGLPLADIESDIQTALDLIKLQPDMVRIYPTLIIKDTDLEKWLFSKKYTALSLDYAVKLCARLIALFELNNINIIRCGLQPSDDLREDGVIIAGPFHPAFRELVENYIYKKWIKSLLKEKEFVQIESNEKNISKLVGINKANKKYFGDKLNIKINKNLQMNLFKVSEKIIDRKEILRLM